MLAEFVFVVLCEVSNEYKQEPDRYIILGPPALVFLSALLYFPFHKNTRLFFRMALNMLALAIALRAKFVGAYACSVYSTLRTLEHLCVDQYSSMLFGAIAVFSVPVYLMRWQYIMYTPHLALVAPLVADLLLPVETFL